MSFLFKWNKSNCKHKKLNEELALASSIRDFNESPLDLNDEELTDDAIVYNLKYLGSTPLVQLNVEETKKTKFSKKTNLATTNAIKKVISTSKSQKKLTEVTISISPKGIDVNNAVTEEPILEIPIYKISYCSVDASHDTIFSFVSTTAEKEENFEINQAPGAQLDSSSSLDDENDLVLHAFQCNKRKLAHTVTLSVARSFERAFQIYQNEQFLKEIRDKKINKENIELNHSENIKNLMSTNEANDNEQCLIDLSHDGPQLNYLYSKERNREFLQNTWVSFE